MNQPKHTLLTALLLAPLAACISQEQQGKLQTAASVELSTTAIQVAEHVRFDAYTGRLVVDRDDVAPLIDAMMQRVRAQVGGDVGLSRISRSAEESAAFLNAHVPADYRSQCAGDLHERRWAVCQTDIASHDTHFGTYVVPAKVVVMFGISTSQEVYEHVSAAPFTVTLKSNKATPGAATPASPPSEPPPAPAATEAPTEPPPAKGDIAARLEKLEQLHKAGAISDEEYKTQRQRLLDSL